MPAPKDPKARAEWIRKLKAKRHSNRKRPPPRTQEARAKASTSMKKRPGRVWTEEQKKAKSKSMQGRKLPPGAQKKETEKRQGRTYTEIYGPLRAEEESRKRREGNRRAKPGDPAKKARPKHNGDYRYVEWRTAVFKRDNYECVMCGTGGNLHAHHLKAWAKYPRYRFDVDNGVTLHDVCHRLLHRGRVLGVVD